MPWPTDWSWRWPANLVVAAEDTKLGEPEIRYGSALVTLLTTYLIGQKKTRQPAETRRSSRIRHDADSA